ncbi:MAG: hypothetical protein NTY71_05305 [Methanoregula sp.]|nr:hypothetical protein [Methanoregula sp.]
MAGRKDVPESPGNMAFSLFDRQERIFKRLDKKIGQLDTRITALEKRGRS